MLSYIPVTLNEGKDQLDQQQDAELNSIFHHTKFDPNWFKNVIMHVTIKFFDAVGKTVVISLVSLNLIKKK